MGHPLVNRIGDQIIGWKCSDDEGCQTPDRIYGNLQDADYSAWGSIGCHRRPFGSVFMNYGKVGSVSPRLSKSGFATSVFLNISDVLICHGWSITLWWRVGVSTAGLVVPWGTW